jgi:DNA-binding ferritin-like protein (Dps family)
LPAEYQPAWQQINNNLMPYGGFTGRDLIPIVDAALGLLEQAAADGQGLDEVLGDDIPGFCAALAGGEGARTYRDRWREQLNSAVARKLARLGG